MTEIEVAATLEHAARLAGAEAMWFETIVARGAQRAAAWTSQSAKLPKRGFVTLDFGVVLDGYMSDMTRTVHMGKAQPEEREVYDAVLEAQEAAVAAVAPGVTAARWMRRHEACCEGLGWMGTSPTRRVTELGWRFMKDPGLRRSRRRCSKQGMVITIEPGVYMPGKFGLRIEDMVLVTATGGEILTPSVKAWIEL